MRIKSQIYVFAKRLRGGVLPTVMVISVLILITIMLLFLMHDFQEILFAKKNYNRKQRANIESALTLYKSYPEILPQGEDSVKVRLFAQEHDSDVTISHRFWGLYELISFTAHQRKIHSVALTGIRDSDSCTLWYRDNMNVVTLAGDTNLKGKLRFPILGMVYGRIGSTLFTGEEVDPGNIYNSLPDLPFASELALAQIELLFTMREDIRTTHNIQNSITNSFYGTEPMVVYSETGYLGGMELSGHIVIIGDELTLDSTTNVSNAIVVGHKVTVREGFKGSVQIFSKDSIIINKNVELRHPSGLFSEKYIGINNYTQINGYMIVNSPSRGSELSFRQWRLARIRGMVYVKGTAQLQGIVTGKVVLDGTRYHSDEGYYSDMLFDFTLLENRSLAMPIWLTSDGKREEVDRVD